MNRRLTWILVGVLSLTSLLMTSVASAQADPIALLDEDGELVTNLASMETDETSWVDLGGYLEALDYQLSWDPLIHRLRAKAQEGETELRLRPGSERQLVDGKLKRLSRAPQLREDRLYFPAEKIDSVVSPGPDRVLRWNSQRRQLQFLDPDQLTQAQDSADPIGDLIEDQPDVEDDQMLVVIDPGHGGRDPGAIGPAETQEKNVVLDFGLRLQELLKEYPEIQVKLTRSADRFLSLDQRARMANELGADLFLSLHANSGPSPEAQGFELFTLSTDEENIDESARERAETENSVLWQFEGRDRDEVEDDLVYIIEHLNYTTNSHNSRRLASMLQTQLGEAMNVPNRGRKRAPFYVLKETRMPAVLLEVGFLSNPEEERLIQTADYQDRFVQAVSKTLDSYRQELY